MSEPGQSFTLPLHPSHHHANTYKLTHSIQYIIILHNTCEWFSVEHSVMAANIPVCVPLLVGLCYHMHKPPT